MWYDFRKKNRAIICDRLVLNESRVSILPKSQRASAWARITAVGVFCVFGSTAYAQSSNLQFNSISNQAYPGSVSVSTTSLSSGSTSYSVTGGPATVSGNIVTFNGGGTVYLQASQAATASYPASTTTTSFLVNTPTSQNYTFSAGALTKSSPGADSPNFLFLDTNGTFYLQNAYSNYDTVPAHHYWNFYTGLNAQDPNLALSAANTIPNTQTLCTSQSPVSNSFYGASTGLTKYPSTSGYTDGNFCDVIGVWVDPDTGNWYGVVHNELYPANSPRIDAISWAVSTNQGSTWSQKNPILTSPYGLGDSSEPYYMYGDGDPRLVVDTASGYFYIFYFGRVMTPSGGDFGDYTWEHVARSPIRSKMANGTWQKFYNGAFSTTTAGTTNWECDPAKTTCAAGTPSSAMEGNIGADSDPVMQQSMVAAPSARQASDLSNYSNSPFERLYVAWDVFLQKYIGVTAPPIYGPNTNNNLNVYTTSDLSTEQWTYAGSVPYANSGTGVRYWWLVDAGNLTSTNNLGSSFDYYCSTPCTTALGTGYENVSVSLNSGAPTPIYFTSTNGPNSTTGASNTYVIQHASAGSAAAASGSGSGWTFAPVGDGYFNITQGGNYLQVADGTTGRAYGAAVSLAPAISSTASTELSREQWRFEQITAIGGVAPATPEYRLVNRYSGLALSFPSATQAAITSSNVGNALTAPIRDWDSTSATITTWPSADQELVFVSQQ
jgi:hypothetical protein